MATVITNSRSGKATAKPRDFMPKWDQGRRQTWRDQLALVKQWNRTLGGTTNGG